jgi:hypothetical protein
MTKIRKQVYDLTLADLRRFGVWEYAEDEEGVEGQDEATVRPRAATYALNPGLGTIMVRAGFRLADGTQMSGFVTPSDHDADDDLGLIQPVIVTRLGQVRFWMGVLRPRPVELANAYERLGRSACKVFPLKYQSAVALSGGPVRGTIPGFLVLKAVRGRIKVDVLK